MLLEMKSRITKQKAKGYRTSIEEAKKHVNKNALNFHKPMLAQRFDKIGYIDHESVLRQYKYDGHRCLVTRHEGDLVAYSRNGKLIHTLDHILEGLGCLPEGVTIDGEIYCHGEKVQTIASWCKRLQPATLSLSYIVYDIVNKAPYQERLQLLQSMEFGGHIQISPTWKTDKGVKIDMDDAIEKGYEGLILIIKAMVLVRDAHH
jgi:ATP-dependent DNA ligase